MRTAAGVLGALAVCVAAGCAPAAAPLPSPPGTISDPAAPTTTAAGTTAAGPTTTARPVPVLGEVRAPHQQGFGEARPGHIDAGGSPTGIVDDVTWQSWGGAEATGTGRTTYLAPGQATAEGRVEPAHLVASDLGTCPDGKLAYRSVHWYFPQHGEKAPGEAGFTDLCA